MPGKTETLRGEATGPNPRSQHVVIERELEVKCEPQFSIVSWHALFDVSLAEQEEFR